MVLNGLFFDQISFFSAPLSVLGFFGFPPKVLPRLIAHVDPATSESIDFRDE